MNLPEIVVAGTLKPDGTLELDQRPNLTPGRVTVVLWPEPKGPPPSEGWWPFMQRTRRELEAAGSHFMKEEELHAHIQWLREGDPIDDVLRHADEGGSGREQPRCGSTATAAS